MEADLGVPTTRERTSGFRYADAHEIRLDVETGVCVLAREIGGSRPGFGHALIIENVDELMDNALFDTPRLPGRLHRTLGRFSQQYTAKPRFREHRTFRYRLLP